ncbi:MICOS complex subunit MIC27 [Neosynchiropus ocellatus]
MAAKVAMVAVPTVLGIASIRVYTVRETPTNFQSTREQLNVYTPLPWSTQSRGVSQQTGIIENSITTARHGVSPVVQSVKGACVSVKKGGINLYHVGQDLYYYLKDPPPGFLPRFGTITMAGLLGMFLARKGSRFKRLAVPLGLMTAGATVCYPAQAVAVFKVTGKTAYAAGRWSSSTVSSLFSSKAPGAPESAAALVQRQASEVPNAAAAEEAQPAACHASEPSAASEESTPSAEVSKTEAAESLPVSPELIIPVAVETSAEESPDQTPTEALSDGTGFKPNPALMDFGQSNPDDEDLYSTRS